jgi:hypothetical protein
MGAPSRLLEFLECVRRAYSGEAAQRQGWSLGEHRGVLGIKFAAIN